jgi:hypothetical protein
MKTREFLECLIDLLKLIFHVAILLTAPGLPSLFERPRFLPGNTDFQITYFSTNTA